MLEVKGLNVKYGPIHAIHDVSMKVQSGQIAAVVGANGAGKSTLLLALAGALLPASGQIYYQGKALPRKVHEVLGRGICLVPERRRLYANLTVKENLLMGAFLRRNHKEIAEDMEKMAALFPIIKARFTQYAGTLSGGEQQMVAIARGLMSRPSLLLLDEPSLGLAPLIIKDLFQIIQQIKRTGTTILLAEQNAFQALDMADYAFVLKTGRIMLTGGGKELMNNPLVQKAYLGIKQD